MESVTKQIADWRLATGRFGERKVFDLAQVSVRELNRYLHRELPENSLPTVVVNNPDGAHSIAAGMNALVDIEINGHVGYYVGGMNKHARIVVNGNAGPGVAENMMSGLVRIRGFASTPSSATTGFLKTPTSPCARGGNGNSCSVAMPAVCTWPRRAAGPTAGRSATSVWSTITMFFRMSPAP